MSTTEQQPGKHRQKAARRRPLMIGIGSLIDLKGTTTYERMRKEMPEPIRRSPHEAYEQVAKLMKPPTR